MSITSKRSKFKRKSSGWGKLAKTSMSSESRCTWSSSKIRKRTTATPAKGQCLVPTVKICSRASAKIVITKVSPIQSVPVPARTPSISSWSKTSHRRKRKGKLRFCCVKQLWTISLRSRLRKPHLCSKDRHLTTWTSGCSWLKTGLISRCASPSKSTSSASSKSTILTPRSTRRVDQKSSTWNWTRKTSSKEVFLKCLTSCHCSCKSNSMRAFGTTTGTCTRWMGAPSSVCARFTPTPALWSCHIKSSSKVSTTHLA